MTTAAPWTYYEQGAVEEVVEEQYGTVLSVAAAIADEQLVVDDVIDFDETGGQLTVEGDVLMYYGFDDDASTLLLDLPLASAYPIDTPVWVYPDTRERRAMIRLDTDGESVDARVPHALYDRLPEGTRLLNNHESVGLYLDGDEWVIDDVLGQEPIVDGSFIDPDTMPPAPPPATDGLPPSGTPTLEVEPLGIGALRAEWTTLVNHDAVSYDVHVSLTDGFTPDATTLYVTVEAQQSATIASLPDGTPLLTTLTYFVRVVPYDEDGIGTMSDQASSSPRVATDQDFSADAIYAMKISANSIQSGEVEADLLIAGSIKTADDGQRVEISGADGLINYGPDNVPRIILPTGGSDPAVLRGVAEVDTLTVHGSAELQGGAHITQGKDLTLDATQQPPVAQPELSGRYDDFALADDDFSRAPNRYGLVLHSGSWWDANIFYGTTLRAYSSVDGSFIGGLDLVGAENTLTNPDAIAAYGGLTRLGSSWFILGQRAGNRQWQIRRYDDSGNELSRFALDYPEDIPRPALGNNGTNLLIARVGAGGNLVISEWTIAGVQVGSSITVSGASPGAGVDVSSVLYGAFDFSGGSYYVVSFANVQGARHVYVINSSGAYQTTRAWLQGGKSINGMTSTGAGAGGRFVARASSSATLRTYSNLPLPESGDTYTLQAAATYANSSLGYETTRGPARSVSMTKRSSFRVSVGGPLPDGVDSVRFHAYVGAGAGTYQPLATQPAPGALSLDYASLALSGTTPSSGTFPGTTSARVVAGTNVMIDGDAYGTFHTGDLKMHAGTVAGAGTPIVSGGTWLLCDGSLVDKTVFAALFAVVGHVFNGGADPGGGKFMLPDMRRRFPRGVDGATVPLGNNDGLSDTSLRTPRHKHTVSAQTTGASTARGNQGTTVDVPTDAAFKAHSHGGETAQSATSDFPFMSLCFLIKT